MPKKYFGVFVSVEDKVDGSLVMRYFTTMKGPYDRDAYQKLVDSKQRVLQSRIRTGGDRDDPKNIALRKDIESMRAILAKLPQVANESPG